MFCSFCFLPVADCIKDFTNIRCYAILLRMDFNEIRIEARGKINLSLNITGVQNDMHLMDSITASVSVSDLVSVRFNDEASTSVRFSCRTDTVETPPLAACETDVIKEKNTVTEAMELLRKYRPSLGAEISVEKGIPIGGGLGGSSADAAAVLMAAVNAMPDTFSAEKLFAESVCVGSDVPSMCKGGFLRLTGIGEKVRPVEYAKLHLVIARRGPIVSSGDAYELFDSLYPEKKYCPGDNDELLRALAIGDHYAIAAQLYNALTLPARKICNDIDFTLHKLSGAGAVGVFMTGSGNCCCGLFANEKEAREVATRLQSERLWATYAVTEKEGNVIL